MDFFFSVGPLWLALPTFVVLYLVLSWAVLLAVRPWVTRVSSAHEEWDRVLGYAMQSYGIFYGILLALIAVSVYENFQRVSVVVLDTATGRVLVWAVNEGGASKLYGRDLQTGALLRMPDLPIGEITA